MAPPASRSPRSGPSPGSVAANFRWTCDRARSRGYSDDATPPVRAGIPVGSVLQSPVARQVAAALLLAAAASGCTDTFPGRQADAPAAEPTEAPLVVFMDSAHPARVYDAETLEAGLTNADLLAERLGDLPIRPISETISPAWRRDGAIAALEPELIVIHYSGFREEDGSGPRERLRYFLTQFGASETEFVIYSRTGDAALDEAVQDLLQEARTEHPSLPARAHVFGLDDHGERSWLSPPTIEALRERVMAVLEP